MNDSRPMRPERRHALAPPLALCLALVAACGDSDSAQRGLELGADHEWKWYPIAGAQCRDGSQAGFSINRHADSKKLVIYLEGGGACYDPNTCLVSPAFTPTQKPPLGDNGIFNRSQATNPFADWNIVYVPYCTGDVHGGTNPNGAISGVPGAQKFVGYTNMGLFLEQLAPTFEGTEQVVVVGISAGGFGASANVPQVLRAFPKAKGNLIDDSGPPMTSTYLSKCLQKKWRETWGLEGSMLAECGADCPDQDDYTFDFAMHLAKTYGEQKSGLIEATEDGVIRYFFGLGTDNCAPGGLLGASEPRISGEDFTAGLLEFREEAKRFENFGTYYPPGEQHTWLANDSVFSTEVDGVKMIDWVRDIIDDKPASHVGAE